MMTDIAVVWLVGLALLYCWWKIHQQGIEIIFQRGRATKAEAAALQFRYGQERLEKTVKNLQAEVASYQNQYHVAYKACGKIRDILCGDLDM